MMRLLATVLLLCFIAVITNAQTIKGKVYRGTKGDTTVANAVIYYGGSTVGTIADEQGNFELAAKPQQIPIVVSCLGYYSATVYYQPGKLLVVRLQPQQIELKTVTVRGKSMRSADGLDRSSKERLFIQEFLGISPYAKSCTIVNMHDISLIYNEGTKTLTANSEKPIIIQNKKLGYAITYYLDNFSRTPTKIHYAGNAFFKEDTASSATNQAEINNNREQVYIGSRMHFIRALWHNTLDTAGFRVTDQRKTPINALQIIRSDSIEQKYIHIVNRFSVYHSRDPDNRSILYSTKPYVFIDKNGFCEQELQWNGPMSDQRVGEQLPFEYRSKYDVIENVLTAKSRNANVSYASVTGKAMPALDVIRKLPGDTAVQVFYEKAYLHTDRDSYAVGDDIWFKAYVVNAQDNTPIDYSHNLYVELINPSAKIVFRKMLRLEKGLAEGDFKLTDSLVAGYYRLRAYTNWMRNFGDYFIFEKTIRVSADDLSDPVAAKAPVSKKQNIKAGPLPKTNPDIRPLVNFFPEGGTMISGVSSLIAVKAEDENGRGITAKGNILNNSGEIVASFNCDSLGFGAFTLLPDVAQHYLSRVSIRQKDQSFALPKVAALGFNMSVRYKQNQVTVGISCNDATLAKSAGQQIYLEAKNGGKIYLRQSISLTDKNLPVIIPDSTLAIGINAITLSDAKNLPLCERLVYIYRPSNTQLSISTNKTNYQPKEQTTIQIKLNKPGLAHLSLAAVNALTVPVQPENIVTYLELQSEVHGRIEQAAKYFDTTNVNRFKQLDLLLLTQGWRGFIWKRIADTIIKFDREVEQGITITGRVRGQAADKPLAGMHVTMHAPKADGDKFFEANTDSAGRFVIYGPKFYGYQYIDFSSRNFNQKNKGKSNSGGMLKIDSLNRDVLPVKEIRSFMTDTLPSAAGMLTRLKVPKNQQLKEVKIVANTNKFVPEIHAITLTDQKDYGTVLQYLLYNIPGAFLDAKTGFLKDGNNIIIHIPRPPFIIIVHGFNIPVSSTYSDGSKIDPSLARFQNPLNLPITNVISITITKFVNMTGYLTYRVNIALRPGAYNMIDYFDNTSADMVGYYRSRIFYQPQFGNKENLPDNRFNTIHWEPNIITDDKGEATVTFNNTDRKGKVQLIVQGVTEYGVPLMASAGYSIK